MALCKKRVELKTLLLGDFSFFLCFREVGDKFDHFYKPFPRRLLNAHTKKNN